MPSDLTCKKISNSLGHCRRNAEVYESQYFKVSRVDDERNVTITTQNVWVMVAKPVAQGLGWITSENEIRQSDLYGLKIHSSSKAMPELEYQWCILPRRSSFTFSGTFLIPNKGGKFLKKLWCCVSGSITR